jgi:hypothetical protein
MNQSPWSALLSVGFSTFLSVLISTISVKIIWLPSEKGLDYATGRDGNAEKTFLAALLIFFRDVPAEAAFRERFAKNPGAARITMRAQAHLEQDGTCTIGDGACFSAASRA